jgi:thiamine monophosphate synthase
MLIPSYGAVSSLLQRVDITNLLHMYSHRSSGIVLFSILERITRLDNTDYLQNVTAIRCLTCSQEYPFVVGLLGQHAGSAEVYRIHVLEYDDTLLDSARIVLYEDRIVGRMVSRTRACECQTLTT